MSPLKRNITRVIIFSAIVLFSAAISSGIYYLKIQKNEDVQNQLQFRELKDTANALGMSFEKLRQISNYFKTGGACVNALSVEYNKSSTEQNKTCLAMVNERLTQIKQNQEFKSIKIKGLVGTKVDGNKEIELKPMGISYLNTYLPIANSIIDNKDSIKLSLQLQTEDLIPTSLKRFSLVMISNQQGDILARRDFMLDQHSTQDLSIISLAPFINNEESDQLAFSKLSQMSDISLAGIDYRLYIQPLENSESWSENEKPMLVGLVPLSTINVNKLLISPIVIMWSVLFLLLLVSFTPLLKLRFINRKYAFTSADLSQVCLGLLFCAGLFSIGANQQMFYQYFIETKIEQSKLIHQSIREDFTKEINALLSFAESKKYTVEQSLHTRQVVKGKDYTFTNISTPNMAFLNQQNLANENNDLLVVEQLATIGENGKFINGSSVYYIKPDLFINSDIFVGERDYFKRATNCDTWQFTATTKAENTTCKNSLYIQRINNLEDGRKTSMLAIPMFDSPQDKNKEILIFNTRLQSFMQRVLPMNFGFAVVNKQGDVLYHSNNEASLIENLFVETNQNQQLRTAIQNQTNSKTPLSLKVKYAGVDHLFVTAPLVSSATDKPLPWSLVVFYNKSDIAMNNMILVFLAIFVLFAIIVPLFFLLRFLSHTSFWSACFYYNPKKTKRYRVWAWFFASLSFACVFSIGLLNDLSLRISLWLFACIIMLVFLHRVHKIDLRAYTKTHYPQTSLIAALGFFILLACSTRLLDMSIDIQNIFTASLGVICVLIAYAAVTNKVPKFISKKLRLALGHNPQNDAKVRRRKYANEERFSSGYIFYLVSIVFLAGAVPSILVANSTHGYLLQRQAQMQSYALEEAIQSKAKERQDYFEFAQISEQSQTYNINKDNIDSTLTTIYPKRILDLATNENSCIAWIKAIDQENIHKQAHEANLSDDILDTIFASLSIQDSLGTRLTYLALDEQESDKQSQLQNIQEKGLKLVFKADKYMLAATIGNFLSVILGFALLIIFLYLIIKHLLAKRLLGEHIPDHFRVLRPSEAKTKAINRWPLLRRLSLMHKLGTASPNNLHILLLNSTSQLAYELCKQLHIPLYKRQVFHINDLLESNAGIFVFQDSLEHQLHCDKSLILSVAISGLDELSHNIENRSLALEALTRLCAIENLNIILVSDTAPGYRLLKQEAYCEDFARTELKVINIDEKLGWAKLFNCFEKEYAWSPRHKLRLADPLSIAKLVEFESNAWEDLKHIKEKFYDYHKRIKSPHNSKDDVDEFWMHDQVIEFFLVQAGPLYRKHWELCTVDEKVALWQLAKGALLNPANSEVIQHLSRRGFVYRDHGWHIINESFKRFVLSAESDSVIAMWMDTTRSGLWPIIRIPLFTLLFVLIVIVVYSSGFALNSFLGVATTTLGIIPLLLKNLSLIKGASNGLNE